MKKATINKIEEILNHHAGGSLINVCGWLLAHQYPIANNGMSRKNQDSMYLFKQFINVITFLCLNNPVPRYHNQI